MSIKEFAIINQGPKFYKFSSNLDGQRYYFNYSYNERNDTWYLTIRNADRDIVLSGLACLTNNYLMVSRFVIEEFFPVGEIQIADVNDDGNDPSYLNFGDNVSAFYQSVVS